MADGLYYNVKAYLGRDFTMEEVKLVQEVNTSNHSIAEWNISDEKAEPTIEQLHALEAEATTLETNQGVRATRQTAYGNIGDQSDEIYKDIDAWKTRIKSIKDANSKE